MINSVCIAIIIAFIIYGIRIIIRRRVSRESLCSTLSVAGYIVYDSRDTFVQTRLHTLSIESLNIIAVQHGDVNIRRHQNILDYLVVNNIEYIES